MIGVSRTRLQLVHAVQTSDPWDASRLGSPVVPLSSDGMRPGRSGVVHSDLDAVTHCTTLSRASNPEYAEAGSTGQAGVRQVTVWVVFAANVKRATRQQLAELVQLLVERIKANGRKVDPESFEWTPPARPFFGEAAFVWRPRTDSNRRRQP